MTVVRCNSGNLAFFAKAATACQQGDPRAWGGATSWLQVLLHQPLLIERAKYHRKFKDRAPPAWYVHTAGEKDLGKLFFLSGVGVQPLRVESYGEIYGESTWVLTR